MEEEYLWWLMFSGTEKKKVSDFCQSVDCQGVFLKPYFWAALALLKRVLSSHFSWSEEDAVCVPL